MKTTAAVLHELQDYWAGLDQRERPSMKEVAKLAEMPYATASRHLNGTTKQGIPSRVRALAIALGRQDLADEVTLETPTKNQDAWWIVELQKEWREDNLEELDRERKAREETERRLLAELERTTTSKDRTIDLLNARIEKLEIDKANQAIVNKELSVDKTNIYNEMVVVRNAKRRYEVMLVIALIFIIWLLLIDARNGSFGLIRY